MLSRIFGYEPPSITESPCYKEGLVYESKLLGESPKLSVYDVDINDGKGSFLHTVEVKNDKPTKSPVVIMHGYGNGIGYLFQNLRPLSNLLPKRSVFGIDMLGFGLSSRPSWDSHMSTGPANSTKLSQVKTAESWFVNSLEEWRKSQEIERMVLCGHSMGGYLSVAYAEAYPERVERLVLLSPVGVPHVDEGKNASKFKDAPFRFRALIKTVRFFWGLGATPMSVLRSLPEGRGKQMVDGYVYRRLRGLTEVQKEALSGYFYNINTLPGSGEYCLHKILKVGAYSRVPLVDRIPALKVPSVHFIYGQHDWMDVDGGLQCQEIMEGEKGGDGNCHVRVVGGAGHLLMLENPEETNRVMADAVEGRNKRDGSYRHHGQADKSEWIRGKKGQDKDGVEKSVGETRV